MKNVSTLMEGQIILPLVQAPSAELGIEIARAMQAGGLHSVEVVLRTPESLAALAAIKKALPELSVGAGTILNVEMLKQAIDAGADYIVTPAVTPKLLEALESCGVPVIPGVSKPSDIALAYEYGVREMKLFPAELSGGAAFLKAIGAVFQDVKFCPTGGVSEANRGNYLALNNVFTVGGSWVATNEWVAQGNWAAITEACKAANLPA